MWESMSTQAAKARECDRYARHIYAHVAQLQAEHTESVGESVFKSLQKVLWGKQSDHTYH